MEVLILLVMAIAQLFAVVIPAAIMLAVQVCALILELIFELIAWAAFGKTKKKPSSVAAAEESSAEKKTPDKKTARPAFSDKQWKRIRVWTRRVALAFGVLLVLTLGTIFVLNAFFFQPTLRWALNKVDQSTGIAITFDGAEGNFWTGRVEISGAQFKRQGNPVSDFDIAIEKLSIDLAMSDALRGKARFEKLSFQGVSGEYIRFKPAEKTGKKRRYSIDSLSVNDVKIDFTDHTFKNQPFQTTLEVERFAAKPYRSNWAVFDILFHSNATGKIDGSPFTLVSKEVNGEKRTEWKATDLRVEHLGQQLGGPFRWLREGLFDIEVIDRWKTDGNTDIESHCSFVLRDLKVQTPQNASLTTKTIAAPVVAFLNKHGKRLPLEFDIKLDEKQFEAKYSAEAAGLTKAIVDGIKAEIARQNGPNPKKLKDVAKEKGKKIFDKIKDKLKKKNENQEPADPPQENVEKNK